MPALPATSHAWHWPPHALLQQTPSTQLFEAHSPAAAHATPLAFEQWPTAPAFAHENPTPPHAASQQNPDAQNPDVHALPLAQLVAFAPFGTQAPAKQNVVDGLAQSVSAVHVVLQAVTPQP